MRARSIAWIAWAAMAGTAAADEPDSRRFEFRETHMGSEFKLVLYGEDEQAASAAASAAYARIAELDRSYNDYDPDSEISRLTARSGGPAVPVGPDLLDILLKSRDFSERTDGAFDVTIQPVVKLWRRARRQHELPSEEQIRRALERVGWRKLEIDEAQRAVKLPIEGMGLDLGGIAKGYAGDEALKVLRSLGFRRALVAGAGDVVMGDAPPDAPGWVVAIRSASDAEGEASRFLSLSRCAVSTSGDAERFVEIGGVRYSHIVNPKTGVGLTGRSSVTVVAPNGTTSDAMATAVSVMGPDRGLELVERTPGVSSMVVEVTDSGPRSRESSGFGKLPPAAARAGAVRP